MTYLPRPSSTGALPPPDTITPCAGHRYEVQDRWPYRDADGAPADHAYDIVCLACGDCRTVRPA